MDLSLVHPKRHGTIHSGKRENSSHRKMISSLHINGYRGFQRLDLSGLGRVNLLVGKNNSGKTSVLEAFHLLTSRGDPTALWQVLWRRGERFQIEQDPRRPQIDVDVSHLFNGHELHVGSKFKLATKNETPEKWLTFEVAELSPKEQTELFGVDPDTAGSVPSQRFALQISGRPTPAVQRIALSRQGGVSSESLNSPHILRHRSADPAPTQYIATESLTGTELIALWSKIQLSPHEELVLAALKFLDEDIERIAAQVSTQPYYNPTPRAGFIIKRKGSEYPIPLGSMGDGMWRMLTMAVAITQSKGGVLLVDEIDTGLHYTAMEAMWRLIFRAATEFEVQVFATTHSYDCVHSLATLCIDSNDAKNGITVQRIEAGKNKAIPYSENEIRLAAERNIEMR